jgi:hypothetical protein
MVNGVALWGGYMEDPHSEVEKAVAFDPMPLHAHFLDDPYPGYRPLRDLDPIHHCQDGSYFLTRYDNLSVIYKGAVFCSDKRGSSSQNMERTSPSISITPQVSSSTIRRYTRGERTTEEMVACYPGCAGVVHAFGGRGTR